MADQRRPRNKKAAPDAAAESRQPSSADELRRQAEERLDGLSAAAAAAAAPVPKELAAAVHELRVHQIELEMQNAELRRAQLELEEQRAKYFELFDLAPVGYLTLSDKGIVDEANFTAAHLLGVERQLLVGQPFSAFVLAADRDAYYLHQRRLEQTGAPRSCELRLQPVAAEPFWAHLESQPRRAADGAPLRYQMTVTDVPERALAQEKLRASEERYRTLFEDNHAVMLLIDPRSGAIAEANPAACAWYGWSRDEMRAMRIDQINMMSESEVRAEMAAARARKRRVFHFKHRRADGTIRDVEVYSGPLELQGKTLLCSLIHDVTARTRAEAALRESEEKYRTILQTTMDGFWLVDTEGRLLEVNEAYCRMSGYSAKELLAMAIGDLSTAETATETGAHIERIRAQGEDRFESRHRRKDGTVFDVEVSVQYLPGGGGGLMVFLRDISDRTRAESYRDMGREVLQILNESGDLQDSIQRVLAALKTKTGLDAVGIRLQDGEDFPYYTQAGFPDGFLRTENTLLERGADGEVRRDPDGRARLECTCGLVISGETDQSSPLFTPGGSFWTNDSFPLLDLPPDQDPRHSPRNQCMHHGYASMALAPIRSGDRIVGLIHLDDRRRGRFTLETIELLEGVAAHLGAALMRKQAEEALRESEEKYRFITENVGEVVWTLDPETLGFTSVSPSVQRLRGFTPREVMAEPMDAALTPEGSKQARAQLARRIEQMQAGEGTPELDEPQEMEQPCKDGSTVWTEVVTTIRLNEKTGRPEVLGLTRDITERKLAEDALRDSEARYRTILNTSPDGIVTTNTEGRILVVSPGAVTMFGCRREEELLGRPVTDFIAPECRERAAANVALTLQGNGPGPIEYGGLRADGSTFDFEANGECIWGSEGQPLQMVSIVRDVTARKRAEVALAHLNDELMSEAAALAEANATITRIAATDHLTGLANRRSFYESLEKAVSLARRHGSPLALASLDLDGLKRVNDSAGHEAGDEALTSFADLLAALCRTEDLPGRLGGDEFSVLLPGIDLGGARGLAERVLAAVRACEALARSGVTVSAGVARWTPGELPDDLLRRADEALYAAKRGGGDAVAGDA